MYACIFLEVHTSMTSTILTFLAFELSKNATPQLFQNSFIHSLSSLAEKNISFLSLLFACSFEKIWFRVISSLIHLDCIKISNYFHPTSERDVEKSTWERLRLCFVFVHSDSLVKLKWKTRENLTRGWLDKDESAVLPMCVRKTMKPSQNDRETCHRRLPRNRRKSKLLVGKFSSFKIDSSKVSFSVSFSLSTTNSSSWLLDCRKRLLKPYDD